MGKIEYILVPGLMDDLFAWLSDSGEPVLIKSCVFHPKFGSFMPLFYHFSHPMNKQQHELA